MQISTVTAIIKKLETRAVMNLPRRGCKCILTPTHSKEDIYRDKKKHHNSISVQNGRILRSPSL